MEDFGLPDNLMMIHTLDLHGCPLVTPTVAPADLWHDLTSFEALRSPRSRPQRRQIGLSP